MWETITLVLLFGIVNGHSDKLQNEADMQSSLMPQELNPAFVTGKGEPWKAVMPLPRFRRELPAEVSPAYDYQLKKYSRIAACVVLALAAAVEITLYIVDAYFT